MPLWVSNVGNFRTGSHDFRLLTFDIVVFSIETWRIRLDIDAWMAKFWRNWIDIDVWMANFGPGVTFFDRNVSGRRNWIDIDVLEPSDSNFRTGCYDFFDGNVRHRSSDIWFFLQTLDASDFRRMSRICFVSGLQIWRSFSASVHGRSAALLGCQLRHTWRLDNHRAIGYCSFVLT